MAKEDPESATQTEDDKAHADVGLVCALPMEVAPFLKRCERVRKYSGEFQFRGGLYDGVRVAVVESGTGIKRATRATRALIEGHTPRWIISCGFCGAIRDDMKIGHILMANEIEHAEGGAISVPVGIEANPRIGLHVGKLVTTDHIVRLVKEKQAIAGKYSAHAVDMESHAVAQVCRQTGTKFVCVRAVSDDLSQDLPKEILSVLGTSGSVRVGAAIGSFFRRPSSVKDMMRLRENAHQAADALTSFLDGVVIQLASAG